MNNTFKMKKRFFVIIAFMLSACSILLIKGCGSSESAKQNWSITALSSTLSAPSLAAGTQCYPDVIFLVTDPDNNAVQGIDVFFYTGANSGIVDGVNNCANAINASMTVPTDNAGTVHVSLVVTPAAIGDVFFIHASSGAATPAQLVSAPTAS